MLLCGWPKRKKKSSTSQDRYDKSVTPIEDQKQVTETSIPENIAVKSENLEDPSQISNQSMHPFQFNSFVYCYDVGEDDGEIHS